MKSPFIKPVAFCCLLLTILLLSSCGSKKTTVKNGTVFQTGEASWYGPGFHGNQTANGERYNQNALTAAHRTLPFNSIVRVISLENNKYVDVRINDRGPFVGDRIIDLSRAAASRIDMIQSGTANVRLIVLQSPEQIDRNRHSYEIFTVQVASFDSRREAEQLATRIRNGWVEQATVNSRQVFRVYVGQFSDRNQANRVRRTLNRQGLSGFVKQVQN